MRLSVELTRFVCTTVRARAALSSAGWQRSSVRIATPYSEAGMTASARDRLTLPPAASVVVNDESQASRKRWLSARDVA